MRRSDREVKDFNDIVEIIKKCDVCRVAFNDTPYPYIVPMNFGVTVEEGNITLYFHCATVGKKLDLLAKNNNVSFEMDCSHELVTVTKNGSCTMAYESVMGTGEIEVAAEEEKYNGLCILMKHYHKEDFNFNKAMIPQTVVLKLNVKSLTGKRRVKPSE